MRRGVNLNLVGLPIASPQGLRFHASLVRLLNEHMLVGKVGVIRFTHVNLFTAVHWLVQGPNSRRLRRRR